MKTDFKSKTELVLNYFPCGKNSPAHCDNFQKFLFSCLPWANPANWCRLDHSSKLCLMFVIFSTTMLFMLSTRCTLERRLSFLESSQLLAPLPSSPPRLSTTPTPSSSSPWLSSSKPITSKIFNNSGFHLNHDPINVPL